MSGTLSPRQRPKIRLQSSALSQIDRWLQCCYVYPVNIIRLLPPAVALVLVGTWLGIVHLSIAAMDGQNAMLSKHIEAARLLSTKGGGSQAKAFDKFTRDGTPLDWRKLAGVVVQMQKSGGLGDLRTMVHLQQRLRSMTPEELVAALDEIAALDLPATSRAALEPLLIAPLLEQQPALVLSRLAPRLSDHDEAINRQLALALKACAKLDARQATEWFDQQVAAGNFNSAALSGRSPTRLQFEGALLGALITAEPTTAAERLAALPDDQRAEAIGNAALCPCTKVDLSNFSNLIRSQVPASDQAAAFARQAGQWVAQGGYANTTAYLDAIKFTPDERLACVEQAVATQVFSSNTRLTTADLENLRAWVSSQVPQETASITAKVLCTAAMNHRKLEFAQAAELAVQYSRASGNDDVLVDFVDNWATRANKEEARELAAKINDAKRRAAILKRLE
ncbi:MAG: hypothetical protein WCJ66_01475 [Verrucomicrobiota bacterium]